MCVGFILKSVFLIQSNNYEKQRHCEEQLG
jgi:hypothetical protein